MTAIRPDGRRLLRIEQRNAEAPIERKPEWIKIRAKTGPQFTELRDLVKTECSVFPCCCGPVIR